MRAAFSVWNERIAPVFDVSQKLFVLEIEEGGIIARNYEVFLDHDPIRKMEKLAGLRVQALVCGAISRPLAEMAYSSGINVIPFIAGDIEEVVKAYLRGGLPNPAMAMPGCCGRRNRIRGGWNFRQGLGIDEISERGQARNQERRQAMPRGDGTGPQGKGPGTGRGVGRCGVKGAQRPAGQPGQGQGAGMGQGRRGGSGRKTKK